MKVLIHRFYDSIKNNTSPPVTREQALLVIETMDEIWKQLNVAPLKFETFVPEIKFPLKHPEKVLVTGGTGFLGRRIVESLVGEGYRSPGSREEVIERRSFARPGSRNILGGCSRPDVIG